MLKTIWVAPTQLMCRDSQHDIRGARAQEQACRIGAGHSSSPLGSIQSNTIAGVMMTTSPSRSHLIISGMRGFRRPHEPSLCFRGPVNPFYDSLCQLSSHCYLFTSHIFSETSYCIRQHDLFLNDDPDLQLLNLKSARWSIASS